MPLTPLGEEEARAAGLVLRNDPYFKEKSARKTVVFASRLQRAVDTASLMCGTLGLDPGDLVCDWRLNEQMYGALTGLNKRHAMAEFGYSQVQRWRRGWNEAPPAALGGASWQFNAASQPRCSTGERLTECEIEEHR